MKSKLIILILALIMLTSCSEIEEADAHEVVSQLFEYVEKGDYASASDLFCANEDGGKTFPEFLDEVEAETELDFQSNIEILEYLEYYSAPSSYFGVVCADIDLKVMVDGEEMMMNVGVLENEDSIECFQLTIYTANNDYDFLCDYID